MAHFTKYKIGDAQRVQNEAERKTDSKSEYFDANKSNTNKTLIEAKTGLKTLINEWQKDNNKTIRKNGVILINEIITKPKNLKEEDQDKFYLLVSEYTKKKLHSAGVYSLIIHNDEYTQHAHISYLALNENTNRWQAREMLNKSFLNDYHRDLENYIYKALGYLVEIRKDNKEEHLSHEDYKKKMKKEEQAQEIEAPEEIRNQYFEL